MFVIQRTSFIHKADTHKTFLSPYYTYHIMYQMRNLQVR